MRKSSFFNKMQRLLSGLLGKYQGKMTMFKKDKILGPFQVRALDGNHSIIIARKPVAIARFIPRTACNDSELHGGNTALLEKRFLTAKELLDRLVAVKQPEPAVLIVVLGELRAMIGRSNHHEASV